MGGGLVTRYVTKTNSIGKIAKDILNWNPQGWLDKDEKKTVGQKCEYLNKKRWT